MLQSIIISQPWIAGSNPLEALLVGAYIAPTSHHACKITIAHPTRTPRPCHLRQRFTYEQNPRGLSGLHAAVTCPCTASFPAQPNPECSAFAKNAEASAASSFFEKQRSEVIVRVTRKCLSAIFSFPEHLAPAEGIDHLADKSNAV